MSSSGSSCALLGAQDPDAELSASAASTSPSSLDVLPARSNLASQSTPRCNGNAASNSVRRQHTYSRQGRQRGGCSSSGVVSSNKRKADYAWLQGADDTLVTEQCRRGCQQNMGGLLWSEHETHQAALQANSSGRDGDAGPDGTVVRYTAESGRRAVFDPKVGCYTYPFSGHAQPVIQVLPLQNGLHILTSSLDQTHKLWTVEGKGLCTFTPPQVEGGATVPCLSICQKVIIAGHGSSTFVWDISRVLRDAGRVPDAHTVGNHCCQLDDHECTVSAVAVSACGSMMASADASGKLVIRFSS